MYTIYMNIRMEANSYIKLASPALQRLETAGFEAYLVGGCVREILREEILRWENPRPEADCETGAPRPESGRESAASRPATDIDITTNALPDEICRVFSDMSVIETGIKHGTVTVLLPTGSGEAGGAAPDDRRIPIEITTYRVDGEYSDGRHPDQVRFVSSLTEDLRRRDFTINAMAMDLRGELKDPFGGREDLEAGIIRAVGEPKLRFHEDGLRILRALRFAAVLTKSPAEADCGFRIEPETKAALFQCAGLLEGISAERIFTELKKLAAGPAAGAVVRKFTDVLAVVLPELAPMKGFQQNNPYHKYDVLEHCIRAMEAAETADPVLKLTALLHDVGKPSTYFTDENGIGHFYGHPAAGAKIVHRMMKRLKADRATTERVVTLVKYHDLVFQEEDRLLKRWMNRYTPETLLEILLIKRADNIATGNVSQELLDKFDRIEKRIRKILEEAEAGKTCLFMKDLAVTGTDLIEEGVPEGPKVGRALEELLKAVHDETVSNKKEALIEYLHEKIL